jgi:predicted N-acetyltransferase YhbS
VRQPAPPRAWPARNDGRLAVDVEFQGRRLGRYLLSHSFVQCAAAARIVGCRGLLVHPLDNHLGKFYAKAGFQEISSQKVPGTPRAMFIAIETLQDALAARPLA